MFKAIKSIFGGREAAKPVAEAPAKSAPASVMAAVTAPAKPAAPAAGGAAAVSPPRPVQQPQQIKAVNPPAPSKAVEKPKTPEEICGITAQMSQPEVRERLALLYKRYNRATSSLDAQLRGEAERMLDAVVIIREKVFGPI